MAKNFLTISIKNTETAYYYAAYLLHSNALLITTPNDFIVPFPLIQKSRIIVSTFIDLDILDLLEPFTIFFDINISPFMLEFLKTYCEQEKIKIVYFTKAESKFLIDDYINVNGKYLFDDDYNLIEYKE